MSTFFIFMDHILGLDFPWIVEFMLSNLIWVAVLSVMMHVLFNGEKFVSAFIFMTFALWLWGDFEGLSGIGFAGAQVLAVYYISKISLLSIVENTPSLRRHLLVISTISGVVMLSAAKIIM